MKLEKSGSIAPRIRKPQRLIIIAAIVAACIVAALFFVRTKPLTVAYVGLSDLEIEAYSELFSPDVKILKADYPRGGSGALDGIAADIIVAGNGLAIRQISDRFAPPPESCLASVPPSLIAALRRADGTVSGFPLQIDHFSLAWDTDVFSALGLPAPASRGAMEAAMLAYGRRVGPALLFAGGEDETLLQVLSVLCVSEFGAAGYAKAVEAIRDVKNTEDTFLARIGDDKRGGAANLDALIEILASWQSTGFLHPEWHNLKASDVKAYMEKNLAFMVLGTLTFRRSVDYQTIYRYGSMPFPAAGSPDALVSPVTGVFFLPRRSNAAVLEDVFDALIEPEAAFRMAKITGKATTVSTARAPDVQAADALSWAAGRQALVNGFYRDAFADTASASAFATAVRDRVRARR